MCVYIKTYINTTLFFVSRAIYKPSIVIFVLLLE